MLTMHFIYRRYYSSAWWHLDTALRIMMQRRVTMQSFSSTMPLRSGEGMLMMRQREGVRTELRICISVREVWEVTARMVTLKLW